MDKRRQTPSDKMGFRDRRMQHKEEKDDELAEGRVPQSSSWRPSDDVFGDGRRMSPTTDTDLDFEGRFGQKNPKK